MIPRKKGSIFFTGAPASIIRFPRSAAFAAGEFGLLYPAETIARDLQPRGIHVAHFVIDGVIGRDSKDSKPDPDAIAENYYQVHMQRQSTRSFNAELHRWVEKF